MFKTVLDMLKKVVGVVHKLFDRLDDIFFGPLVANDPNDVSTVNQVEDSVVVSELDKYRYTAIPTVTRIETITVESPLVKKVEEPKKPKAKNGTKKTGGKGKGKKQGSKKSMG